MRKKYLVFLGALLMLMFNIFCMITTTEAAANVTARLDWIRVFNGQMNAQVTFTNTGDEWCDIDGITIENLKVISTADGYEKLIYEGSLSTQYSGYFGPGHSFSRVFGINDPKFKAINNDYIKWSGNLQKPIFHARNKAVAGTVSSSANQPNVQSSIKRNGNSMNLPYTYSSLHYFENRTETRNFVLYEENPKVVGYNAVVELPDIWYKIRGEKNKLDDAFTYDPATKIFTYYAPNENGAMRIYGEIIFTDDQHLIFKPAFSCSMFNAGEKVLMRETNSCDHWFIGDSSTGANLWIHTYVVDAMRYILHNR